MKRLIVLLVSAFTLLAFLSPSSLDAQTAQTRDGFWFNIGLGYGSAEIEIGGTSSDREGGLTGQIALGGTLSDRVLLGGAINFWTKEEQDVTFTIGVVTAMIRFYTSDTGGFFLTGGLGVGTVDVDVSGFGSDNENGLGVLLGLGYDFRVGDNVSITPFWNGYAMSSDLIDANVGQIGVGVTIH